MALTNQAPTICLFICNCVYVAFLIYLGSITANYFAGYNSYYRMGTKHLAGLYSMGRDWQQNPYTDLIVTDDTKCPIGWQATYERIFYGLDIGCDCTGIFSRWIENPDLMTLGYACSYNQTVYGCT